MSKIVVFCKLHDVTNVTIVLFDFYDITS